MMVGSIEIRDYFGFLQRRVWNQLRRFNIPSPLFTLIRMALGILGLSCNLHSFVYLKVQFNLHSFTISNYRYLSDVPLLDMAGLSTVRLS